MAVYVSLLLYRSGPAPETPNSGPDSAYPAGPSLADENVRYGAVTGELVVTVAGTPRCAAMMPNHR